MAHGGAGYVAPKPPPKRTPRPRVPPTKSLLALAAPHGATHVAGVVRPPTPSPIPTPQARAIHHVLTMTPTQVMNYRPGGRGTRPLGFVTASQVQNYKTERARFRAIDNFAHEINNTGTLSPKSILAAKAHMRGDPSFQDDLNKEVKILSDLHAAHEMMSQPKIPVPFTHAGLPIFTTAEQAANPLEWVYGGVRGIGELRRRQYAAGTLDLAGLVPLFRPLRGARAVMEGVNAATEGAKAAEIAQTAMRSWQEGRGVILPTIKATARRGRSLNSALTERQVLAQAVRESTSSPAEAK